MATPENPVQLGIVGAAHGIKGEVRVKPFTDDPAAIGDYGPLHTGDGRTLKIAGLRPARDVMIVRFEGIADRNAAETLVGQALLVDRSAMPADLEEEEYYHADLVGLAVLDEVGEALGEVVAIHNFGAGDILEIRPGSGQTQMIPFTSEAVPDVDLDRRVIRIDREAAGLNADAGQEKDGIQQETKPRRRRMGSGN